MEAIGTSNRSWLNGLYWRPPPLKPTNYGVVWYMEQSRPLRQGECLTVNCNKVRVPPVVILGFQCSPTNIARLIITIVIFAIKRMCHGWPNPYIFKKSFEIEPCSMDGNPAPSVSWIAYVFQVLTTSDHFLPNSIFGELGNASFVALTWTATTAFTTSASKIVCGDRTGISAMASAKPSCTLSRFPRISLRFLSLLNYHPITKCLAGQVMGDVHERIVSCDAWCC